VKLFKEVIVISTNIMADKLTDFINFDFDNLVFRKAYDIKYPPTVPMKARLLPFKVRHPDGSEGDWLIKTEPDLYTFGISAGSLDNKKDEKKDNGSVSYSLPLCMWDMSSPSENQRKWTSKMEDLIVHVDKYMRSHDENYYDSSVKVPVKSPLYWKRENGRKVEGRGPVLYPKLETSKNGGTVTITSAFYTSDGDVDPLTLIGQRCKATSVLRIKGARITGNVITLQVELYAAKISLSNKSTTSRRLLIDTESMDSPKPTEQHTDVQRTNPSSPSSPKSPKSPQPQPKSKSMFDTIKGEESDAEKESEDEKPKKVVYKTKGGKRKT
jgi:hypothetical protein